MAGGMNQIDRLARGVTVELIDAYRFTECDGEGNCETVGG